MSVQYLRQASRPLIQTLFPRTAGTTRCPHLLSRGSRYVQSVIAPGRSLVTSSICRRDFVPRSEGFTDHVSPFKKQRQTELREEQESEDPLYPESHPRLHHRAERMSVPEFIEAFNDHLDETKDIFVCGRVRSKRIVGKNLIFLDIVNEFERLQVMVNRSQCMLDQEERRIKFSLFRSLIEVGDHICRIPNAHCFPQMLTIWQRSSESLPVPRLESSPSRPKPCLNYCRPPWSRSPRSSPTPRRECKIDTLTCWSTARQSMS